MSDSIKRVCIFCGSSPGARPSYAKAAIDLARALGDSGRGIVYGGSSTGLMGRIADTALDAGGEVIGVIPTSLFEREIAHEHLTELHQVATMLERKERMAELSDAFVTIPGGLGTMDELFEVLTWGLLGIHHKPMVLLDVDGYYGQLLGFLDHAVGEGFIRPEHRALLRVASDVPGVIAALDAGVSAAAAAAAPTEPLASP
ncbi:MAG: TIGR00730 family Rossman fold protein [Myxococcales bacterium]|nr:TIGR00730 family Rossman fold protein [Myxococcales bacterium]